MNTITTTTATYYIDDPSEFAFATYNNTGTASDVGALVFTSKGATVSIARDTITDVNVYLPLERAYRDYFCYRLFQGCTSLKTVKIGFYGTHDKTLGDGFLAYTFYNCKAITSLRRIRTQALTDKVTNLRYGQTPAVGSTESNEDILMFVVPGQTKFTLRGNWTIDDGDRTLQVIYEGDVVQEFKKGSNPTSIVVENKTSTAQTYYLYASGETTGGTIECDKDSIEFFYEEASESGISGHYIVVTGDVDKENITSNGKDIWQGDLL